MAHNLALLDSGPSSAWAGTDRDHQNPQAAVLRLWWDGSPARRAALPCIFHQHCSLGKPSSLAPWPDCVSHSRTPRLTASLQLDPTSPQTRASPGPRRDSLLRILSPIPRIAAPAEGHRGPMRLTEDRLRRPPIYPNGAPAISPVAPSPTPCRYPHAVHRCPSAGFGFSDGS